MNKEQEVLDRKPELNDHYKYKFRMDSTYAIESKYIYKLRSLVAMDINEEFDQLIEKTPDFKGKEFEDEYYLIQGIFLFQHANFSEAEPYFILSKSSSNWRNKITSFG